MRIDFRTEYQTISVISFSITFISYLFIRDKLELPDSLAYLRNFLLGLGFYVIVFKLNLMLYNKWLWKFIGYKNIDISGCWRYTIRKSATGLNRVGYAYIQQDMYDITIYGFNLGGGNSANGLAIWRSSNVYISHRTLYYDYELVGERPGRASHISKGRSEVHFIQANPKFFFISSCPKEMAGTFYSIPIDVNNSNLTDTFGSLYFERVKTSVLASDIKAQFTKPSEQGSEK